MLAVFHRRIRIVKDRAARTGENFDAGNAVGAIVNEVRLVMSEVERLRRAA